ncbi:MAG: thioredoxin domain-containing protein [bacterium]|nr:thioredoxin domain-containing protein [bacterium]
MKNSNRLINSTSPYLLQHAYNPVDWYPWGEEALQKAKDEDKPIIVSIGYSACHWCHVMEHQSFENENIAKLMNSLFVCIKVDREERPDVDQVYMDAVQAMGLQGGWPLNVFLTPEQKPFYGGTYFPPNGWMQLLASVGDAFQNNREKLEESAVKFTEHLNESELKKYGIGSNTTGFDLKQFDEVFKILSTRFDHEWGGIKKAPKFPMPSIWRFLNRYHYISENNVALEHNLFTLSKIASGGIYDHIAGGFARYSVDGEWHVPHFEKMLYDNGQLLSLYAEAYKISPEPLFKKVIEQTINWLKEELTTSEGGFCSALDADSEGEEGKFYVWTEEEIKTISGDDFEVVAAYYNVLPIGNWEEGKNVLRMLQPEEHIAKQFDITVEVLREKISSFEIKAKAIRSERVRPGLDDKILTSWNGLMLRGLVDAYSAIGNDKILDLALKNGEFIIQNLKNVKGLFRTYKEGKASIDAYLEDYCWVIDALHGLYEITFDFKWLKEAKELADFTIDNFYDEEEKFFHFTSNSGEELIARKKEIFDNVIPSSNAGIANALYRLGLAFQDERYTSISKDMVASMIPLIQKEPEYLSYWGCLLIDQSFPTAEIVVAADQLSSIKDLDSRFIPNSIKLQAGKNEELPLAMNKPAIEDKTTFYVCFNKTCKMPVFDVNSVVEQIESRI